MLKQLTAFFTAAVMACATPLACNAEVIKHEVNVPPNILVLGDSIAAGYGLEGYSENRYSCASYANLLHDQYDAELKDAGGCRLLWATLHNSFLTALIQANLTLTLQTATLLLYP